VAVVNFPPRNVAGVASECLVRARDAGGVVLLRPERAVEDGTRMFQANVSS
jgi:hypothetical protein